MMYAGPIVRESNWVLREKASVGFKLGNDMIWFRF